MHDGGLANLSFAFWPFAVESAGLIVLLLLILLIRGNPMLRGAIGMAVAGAIPFTLTTTFAAASTDLAEVELLFRIGVGPLAFVGPAILWLLLALSPGGFVVRHVPLLLAAVATALVSCVVTWSTDLVIDGAWRTSMGVPWSLGGPLHELHLANFLWFLPGAVIARRGRRTQRTRFHYRRIFIVGILILLAASDGMLSRRVGVLPLSWIPGLVAAILTFHGILRRDLLHRRGLDAVAALEVLVVIGVAGASLWLVNAVAGDSGPNEGAAVTAGVLPVLALAQAGILALRARARARARVRSDDVALEACIARCQQARDEDEIARPIEEYLQGRLGLTEPRLLLVEGDALVDVSGPRGPVPLDGRVRVWLRSNRAPLLEERLAETRLGALRGPVESILVALRAAVVLPLVDRGELVGLVASGPRADERAIGDATLRSLGEVQDAAARAVTYVRLYRELEAQAEVAREVEVASAVQYTSAVGERTVQYSFCELQSHYEPASQFGGDWWVSFELPDQRVLVVAGDVTGQGVPAALLAAAMEGACRAAHELLGPGDDVRRLLELLDRSVKETGRERYTMTAVAALYDPRRGRVSLSSAGYPFPYLVREAGGGRRRLEVLVARGTPLGAEATPVLPLAHASVSDGDVAVFLSNALVDARGPDGSPYEHRRLQRLLRREPPSVRGIMADLEAHLGSEPLKDDVTLLIARFMRAH